MRLFRQILLGAALLAFWLLLSWRLDPLFLGMGIGSAIAITIASTPLLERTIGPAGTHPRVRVLKLLPYVLWLLGRMLASAIQIAWIVINPRVPPEPGIVRLPTGLQSPAARAMLSNSLTLVPGTMTLEMDEHELTVHSFTPDAVDDLASAAMQNRIADIFGDEPQRPPEMRWESGHTPEGFEPGTHPRAGRDGGETTR
jgi:multicomponent Na+:H+ antiporter subunit E